MVDSVVVISMEKGFGKPSSNSGWACLCNLY